MAYTGCAASVAANIVPDCANPIVGGFTGRAILFPLDKNPVFTFSATNDHVIEAITIGGTDKFIAVDNANLTTPFDGSNEQSNGDTGRFLFTKNATLRLPDRGAKVSKEVIEPLTQSALGFVGVFEMKDRKGLGSFKVVGAQQGLKPVADGITRNESENGGDIVINMSCTEPWFEIDLFDTDYATTLALFETYFANNM